MDENVVYGEDFPMPGAYSARYKDTEVFVAPPGEGGLRMVCYYDGHGISVDTSLLPNLVKVLQGICEREGLT